MNAKAVALLKKVKAHILAEPRRYNQIVWRAEYTQSQVTRHKELPPCGTVCCIAGWVQLLGDGKPVESNAVSTRARQLLGIRNPKKAFRLFGAPAAAGGWPQPYRDQYYEAISNPEDKARIAAARIDHFIKTDGAE